MRRTAHALAVETDEVPVISNETLEANIAFIRADITDLKVEVRAVVTRTDQDIRELRADNKTLRDKIDVTHASLAEKIEKSHASLDEKIDTKFGELSADMKAVRAEIKEMCTSIASLKGMQNAILWVLSSVSLVAAIVTIAKTLRWI
jgi:hypothetical protein